jgi:transposase InsO family protein
VSSGRNAPSKRRRGKAVLPAETGRPETAAEFAARASRGFVLKGPQQRKEGESGTQSLTSSLPERLVIRIPARKPGSTNVPNKETPVTTVTQSAQMPSLEHERDSNIAERSRDLQQLVSTTNDIGIQPLDPLPLHEFVSGGREPIDLLNEIKGRYKEDRFFVNIVDKPRDFRNFEVTDDGLIYLKLNEGLKVLCIPKIKVGTRSVREIVISEAHTLLAHLGANKTLIYLRDQVWWKEMTTDVRAFCESCIVCKRTKPSNQKPYGLLHPLPVPTQPWEVIGIDFVGPLPQSKDRDATYDSITVVIDLLTSMVHLVPSRTNYTARQVAELVFEHIYKLHGLPKAIVSDRDSLFTSIFWKHLHQLIGTQLKMSSAYHPETDGSTERANRTVVQMIRQCIGDTQKDWVSKLPAIEFAINSSRSDSTGYAPFFLNFGRIPRPMVWTSADSSEFAGVRVFAQRLKGALIAAHDSILAARVKQIRSANRRRQVAPFQKDELVYISTKNMTFPKGLARKLVPKYVGPYPIIRDFGNNSFRVQIPDSMRQRGIHDVFHSSLLRPHVPNDDRLFPGRRDGQVSPEGTGNPEGEWAADKIISHVGSKTQALFEVLWKAGDKTWLPYHQVKDLNILEPYLEASGVEAILELSEGIGEPPINDPQIFVGHIIADASETMPEFLVYGLDDFLPSDSLQLNATIISPTFTMPKDSSLPPGRIPRHSRTMDQRLKAIHPNLRREGDYFYISSVGSPASSVEAIHPLHLELILDYDIAVRQGASPRPVEPLGYLSFAETFNDENPRPYRLASVTDDGLWVPKGPLIPRDQVDLSYSNPDAPITHPLLRLYEIVDAEGRVKEDTLRTMQSALMHPIKERHRREDFKTRGMNERLERKHLKEVEKDRLMNTDWNLPCPGQHPVFTPTPRVELQTPGASGSGTGHGQQVQAENGGDAVMAAEGETAA